MPGSLIIAGTSDPEYLARSAASLAENPDEFVLVAPISSDQGAAALAAVQVPGEKRHFDGLLGGEPGEVELVRYNLPGLQSTNSPSRSLRDLFPGLRERSRRPVTRHGVTEVFAAGGGLPTPVNVRLDELGSEAEILTVLEERGLLDRLGKLSLRCGREALFEGSWSSAQIREWLTERHFRLEALDESDPDFHELTFVRDTAAAKIAELESRIVALAAAREADLAEASDRLRAVEKRAVGAEGRLAETEKQLTRRSADLNAQAKSHADAIALLEEQREARIASLESALAERDAVVEQHTAEREAEKKTLADARASFEEQSKQREARIAALESQLAERNKVVEQRTAERDNQAKAHSEIQATLERVRKENTDRIAALEKRVAEQAEQADKLVAERDVAAKAHVDAQVMLERSRNQAGDRIAALENQIAEQRKVVEEHTAERDEAARRQVELQAALDDVRKEAGQMTATLAAQLAERNRVIEQRTAERDANSETLGDTQATLEDLRKSTGERIASLAAQVEQNTSVKAELEQKLKAAEKELSANVAALADSRKERDRMGADLSLALKMQILLSADLEALREKLRASELERESHEGLLRKLAPRLHQAARQIREMQLVDAPRLSPGSPEMTAIAQAPAKPKKKGRKKK